MGAPCPGGEAALPGRKRVSDDDAVTRHELADAPAVDRVTMHLARDPFHEPMHLPGPRVYEAMHLAERCLDQAMHLAGSRVHLSHAHVSAAGHHEMPFPRAPGDGSDIPPPGPEKPTGPRPAGPDLRKRNDVPPREERPTRPSPARRGLPGLSVSPPGSETHRPSRAARGPRAVRDSTPRRSGTPARASPTSLGTRGRPSRATRRFARSDDASRVASPCRVTPIRPTLQSRR